MKRPSYRSAVDWIARNDSAGDDDALDKYAVSGLTTVLLVADIFDVPAWHVGDAVVSRRRAINKGAL